MLAELYSSLRPQVASRDRQRASTDRLEAHQGVIKRPAISTFEVHRCAHARVCILDKHRLKAEDELLSYKIHLVITL